MMRDGVVASVCAGSKVLLGASAAAATLGVLGTVLLTIGQWQIDARAAARAAGTYQMPVEFLGIPWPVWIVITVMAATVAAILIAFYFRSRESCMIAVKAGRKWNYWLPGPWRDPIPDLVVECPSCATRTEFFCDTCEDTGEVPNPELGGILG